jgi:four helix bundle protein
LLSTSEETPAGRAIRIGQPDPEGGTSIPANIAEGYARRTRGDYIHHLAIAAGSLAELETHWIVVVRLGQLRQEELQPFFAGAGELGKMLEVLIQKLKAKKP